ncbi:hypothetical protein, partial [Yersinia enterocolitica]
MKYYVHTLADNQNDHEVHIEPCYRLPDVDNREYLGEFDSCEPALKVAKNLGYSRVNGCHWCCKDCH